MGIFRSMFGWRIKRNFRAYGFSQEDLALLTDSTNLTEWEAFRCMYIPGQEGKIVQDVFLRGKVKEMMENGTFSERTLTELKNMLGKAIEESK